MIDTGCLEGFYHSKAALQFYYLCLRQLLAYSTLLTR